MLKMMFMTWAVLLLAGGGNNALGRDDPASAAVDKAYREQVAPLLQRYCSHCHGPEKPKGGLNLSAFDGTASVVKQRKVWSRVLENLESEVMPPDDADQPTADERGKVVAWIQATLSKADCKIEQPGRVTVRRLNRSEYNNTIRDLLGVDMRPADDFPFDDVGYGFDNIGDVLTLPPMLMEKYVAAAEHVSEAAIVVPDRFDGKLRTWTAPDFQGPAAISDAGRCLASESELTLDHVFPDPGAFRLRIVAHGDQAGDQPVRMAVKLDGKEISRIDVPAEATDPGVYEVPLVIEHPGAHALAVAFVNDFFQPDFPDPKRRDRNLYVHSATLAEATPGELWPMARVDWRALQGGKVHESEQQRGLTADSEIFTEFEAPRAGSYRFVLHAHGGINQPEPARFTWNLDGREVGRDQVWATWERPETYTLSLHLDAGKHKLALGFVNRDLLTHAIEMFGPTALVPQSHKRLIQQRPNSRGEWSACTRENLGPFLLRAYRRPPQAAALDPLCALVERAGDEGEPYEQAMRYALQAILVNPNFLYRVELDAPTTGGGEAAEPIRDLNDFELASRLSYFLWASMPDDTLLKLAAENTLHDDATLEAQTIRMLRDPKARTLVDNFAEQWLQIRNVTGLSPDPRRFKDFDRALLSDMKRETNEFFWHIIAEDRDVRELLDSDYTFLNERLAKFYGIGGVAGAEFRKVGLTPETHRGGLLTQASVLTVTSNPTRTSPVKRGKWILEQILGTPPPAPPPDVPPLKDDRKSRAAASLRQRLEEHRANPSCAACHAKMDPLGFSFENFNAVGAWRDKDGNFPIDASGTLPGGRTVEGARGLKQYLKEEKSKQFVRTLTEKLMTYALGRGLEPYDTCSTDAIADRVAADGHRFSRIVIEIVKSDPFRKRAREGVPAS